MAMIEPERFEGSLTLEEDAYRQQLERAYHHCHRELRQSAAVKLIQNNVQGCETMYKANRLLADMEELYGRFINKNSELKQAILVEKMYEDAEMIRAMAAKVKDQGQYQAAAEMLEKANNIREKAAKIEGIDKINRGFDPSDFKLPAVVVTSDPAVLKLHYEDASIDEEE